MKQSLSNVVLDTMGKAVTPQGNVSTKWGTVHFGKRSSPIEGGAHLTEFICILS